MDWKEMYKKKLVSVEGAARAIKSHDRVWYNTSGSVPVNVINEICNRKDELFDVRMFSGLVFYPFVYFKGDYKGHISHTTLFMGPVERSYLGFGNIDVLAYQFGHTDWVLENIIKPDVFIADVPPPDENGNFSYGMNGTVAGHTAAKMAKTIVVQVNRQAPYVHGSDEAFIHVRDVHYICEQDHSAHRHTIRRYGVWRCRSAGKDHPGKGKGDDQYRPSGFQGTAYERGQRRQVDVIKENRGNSANLFLINKHGFFHGYL
jgi:4-hydroxybutyrate CoA-transferase